jgi:hypothetical protein
MEKHFVVLDDNGEPAGSLDLALCRDFASLENEFGFRGLENWATFQGHPLPATCGFQHFKQQLPIAQIYPVVVLWNMEIFLAKRRQGIGSKAIRAFRAIAEDFKPRIGWLRIGIREDENRREGVVWRQRFYERDSWVAFENPPIDGLIAVWMYHLLPAVSAEDKALRLMLVEKAPEPNRWLVVRKRRVD